jgi:hypothetical protein
MYPTFPFRRIHRPGDFHRGGTWHLDAHVGVPHLVESKIPYYHAAGKGQAQWISEEC